MTATWQLAGLVQRLVVESVEKGEASQSPRSPEDYKLRDAGGLWT
jgi:hypothetical protein